MKTDKQTKKKQGNSAGPWWLTAVILAIWEDKMGRIAVGAKSGQTDLPDWFSSFFIKSRASIL
jgi:hypothetical protein